MNLLNRFVSILVIILVWFVIVLVVAAPEASLGWAQQGLDWASANAAAVSARQPGWLYLLIRAGVIVATTLIALGLLWAEVRRKKTPVVKIKPPSGGEASVTAESVERRLVWHLDQLAEVVSATAVIRPRGAAVDVTVGLETSPDVDIPMKTEEAIAVTRDVIETQMGLKVNKTEVQIKHAPYQAAL
ncbi:MAG: hypothetical protein KDI03_10105 [Anaerolineae bacterium]|nr:hypothetical protein [Anaerolineae bacterium]MCB0200411.1 hypothetical protein [Anaerolineae bacterium]MCB0204689.1 hypothetical protein [Anaerolineae bacterium]MCB0253791.1 hypothetical protein [Anaerolineae bacterium]